MIREIDVDNYKSLSGFKLRLKRGINALVGPNGSGKTNIISFFEFLSYLPQHDLANAISLAGGVGTIFRKTGQENYSNQIRFAVFGSIQHTKTKHIAYKYEATVAAEEDAQIVIYKSQRLKLRSRTVESESETEVGDAWDLDISTNLDAQLKQAVTVRRIDKRKIKWRFGGFAQVADSAEILFEQQLSVMLGPDQCLVSLLRYTDADFAVVLFDLQATKYFNIIPSRVKQPEDGSSEPVIRKDGSGLASTLYAIKRASTNRPRPLFSSIGVQRYYYDRFSNVSLAKIREYASLANKEIKSLDVDNSPFDNQLKVTMTISDPPDECTLSLAAMSDGTIKWLTFITLLLTHRSLFAVEEPENFLHPSMQTELIRLMRNLNTEGAQLLLSTHSETILNALQPSEVIVTSFRSGRTVAIWPQTAEYVREEIIKTGFGLGYYYTTGALEE